MTTSSRNTSPRHKSGSDWYFLQGDYGLFYLAAYSLLLGVRLKDKPPGSGTYQDILVKYGLISQA